MYEGSSWLLSDGQAHWTRAVRAGGPGGLWLSLRGVHPPDQAPGPHLLDGHFLPASRLIHPLPECVSQGIVFFSLLS